MSPCILYGGVSVDVGEETQTEPVIVIIWRVCEPVNDDGVVESVVDLPHPAVEFVVRYAAPVFRLLVGHGLSIDCRAAGVHLRVEGGGGQRQHRLVLLGTVGRGRGLRAQGEGGGLGLLAGRGDTAGAPGARHAGQGGERGEGGEGGGGAGGDEGRRREAVLSEGDVVRHGGLRDLLVGEEGVARGKL